MGKIVTFPAEALRELEAGRGIPPAPKTFLDKQAERDAQAIPPGAQLVPKHITQSDAQPIEHPTECWQMDHPKLGHIWRMNARTGELDRSGTVYAMVVGLYPLPVTGAQMEYIKAGGIIPQNVDIAVDYTRCPRSPLHRLHQSGYFAPADVEMIRSNVTANESQGQRIDTLLDRGDPRETCILVMTGPSLNSHIKLLERVDRSRVAIIAVNSAALAVASDYYFALDRRVKPEWAKAAAHWGATLVAHPMVPPETLTAFEPSKRYLYGHPGRGDINGMIRSLYSPNLQGVAELEMGVNVGCSAVHFAFAMGFKHCAIVGMDVAWDSRNMLHWRHNVNEIKYDVKADVKELTVHSADGQNWTAKCRVEYLRAYMQLVGHAYWWLQHDREIYNCTGNGAVWQCPDAFANYAIELRDNLDNKPAWLTPMPSYRLMNVLERFGALLRG